MQKEQQFELSAKADLFRIRTKKHYVCCRRNREKKIPYNWSEIFKTIGFLLALLIEQLLLISLYIKTDDDCEHHVQYQQHIFIISVLPWIINILHFLGWYCLKTEVTHPCYLFIFTYPAPIAM